jgi:hypothetical protein
MVWHGRKQRTMALIRFTLERETELSVATEESIEYIPIAIHISLLTTLQPAAMEQFCSPSRRYQDILDVDDYDWTEVQLAVPVEDFLAYRWVWEDLQAFLTGDIKPKLLWITENAFLLVEESGDMYRFAGQSYMAANIEETAGMTYPNAREHALTLVQIYQSDHLIAELGVFWRAVATSNSVELAIVDDLNMSDMGGLHGLGLPSGPLLSQFLRDSPLLRVLDFDGLLFMEEHCRALL